MADVGKLTDVPKPGSPALGAELGDAPPGQEYEKSLSGAATVSEWYCVAAKMDHADSSVAQAVAAMSSSGDNARAAFFHSVSSSFVRLNFSARIPIATVVSSALEFSDAWRSSLIRFVECDCSSGAGLDVARNGWFSAGSYDSATEVLPIGTHRQLP